MNIFNSKPREVVCISNKDNKYITCDVNSPLLEVGKTYNVISVSVYSWHTEVELYEFPNLVFNSTCFEEKRGK